MMSCNGCRVLRKGCSESCILRPCLQWIQNPKAQGYATVFVAKFFGRAGLMSFISSVPENQRPALFQSLLFEACGRTINPVNGAVGLLWSGNSHLCQMAVETVLRGGILSPVCQVSESDDAAQGGGDIYSQSRIFNSEKLHPSDLDLYLMPDSSRTKMLDGGELVRLRPGTPSMNSDGSDTTNCDRDCYAEEQTQQGGKLLNLFV